MISSHGHLNIVLDLRCLQDPNYASRGIGRHALGLLRHAPPEFRLVGLVDETLPPVSHEVREMLDAVYSDAYAASRAGSPSQPPACVVMLSPMTHDPLPVARLLSDPAILKAALVYDFIPYRWPDIYLSDQATRLNYTVALRWLARCDVFVAISRSSAADLSALLRVPEDAVAVSGCPLDPAFETTGASPHKQSRRHLLVVGGGDARKNPEVVIRAHATSPFLQQGSGIPLVIAGNYSEADADSFRTIAEAASGRQELIEVPGHVSDSILIDLYKQAFAMICPSRDEGFSIPVIEGMAAGLPCVASDIPAHAELVTALENRFPPNDHAALRPKLERAVTDASWQAATLERQADVWPRFRSDAVAQRFWGALQQRLAARSPAVLRGHRPRVALLSPMPPTRSGVADYTAATCAQFGQLVDLHVFTETERPATVKSVSSMRPISELPHLHSGFDRVINVLGNSHYHARIFEILLRYGGACIAHDARMLSFYYAIYGQERACEVASQELGRFVAADELIHWLNDEAKLEALFLGEIARAASPIIVHSPVTVEMMTSRYAVTPSYLPFSVYRPWKAEELDSSRRVESRRRLGLSADEIAIATFGFVHHTKAPEECVWALELLRGWGIPASLHFVGDLETHPGAAALRQLTETLGLAPYVRFVGGYVSEQTYRDYLVGADLGVQLRTYGLGGLSGALLDCIATGLPSVTNASLGAAVGVPDYIRRIPDAISPLLLAEALADLLDAGLAAQRPEAERYRHCEQRSLMAYATKLCEILELDVARPTTKPVRSVA
ncbi:MAG TPA: glycosyltransferase [Acidiphilium sp.]|nr:glycosyltransferase [Acidiphilium sp.]